MTDDTRGPNDHEGGDGPSLDEALRYLNDDSGAIEQVRQMCNVHLEQPLAPDEERRLATVQEWFEEQQNAFVVSLQSGRMSRQVYLDTMNALLADSMNSYAEVLGPKRFLQVFGEAGYEPDKLIDKETFLSEG